MATGASTTDHPTPPHLTNLGQRLVTTVVMLPIVLYLSYTGGWGFTLLAAALTAVGALEFYALAHHRPAQGSALIGVPFILALLLAFHAAAVELALLVLVGVFAAGLGLAMLRHPGEHKLNFARAALTGAGLVYVGIPAGLLIAIRHLPDGLLWLCVVFALTWGTDTFAYIGGRLWGKTKLAPAISPKKTVEGALVGWIGGAVTAFLLLTAADRLSWAAVIMLIGAPLLAVVGDLFESALKRHYHIKDSHVPGLDVFPGHGGVLDRIDGLIFVTCWCAFWIAVFRLA